MELRHPHITGTDYSANQNCDLYLIVYTDVEVNCHHPEYDEKLHSELRELVIKHIGRDMPYEGRFMFRLGGPRDTGRGSL